MTRLHATGSGLVYSTFLGGSSNDAGFGNGLAIDGAGSAYVMGDTHSANFPTTTGAAQTTHAGGELDVVVAKLNATGSWLVYSTYLGGSGTERSSGIAVDGAGSAYVTGHTLSTDFPTTAGAPQTTHGGGVYDAFVTRLNATGSGLVYSTYLGGSDDDLGNDIALGPAGGAYVTGYTFSTNFPTTAGAAQTTLAGFSDGFVAKIATLPTSIDECKNGGWKTFGVFKNQGDCVSFVASGGKNPPSGP